MKYKKKFDCVEWSRKRKKEIQNKYKELNLFEFADAISKDAKNNEIYINITSKKNKLSQSK
jgi:hypothetical protein